jgi:hypothetical protein
MTPHGWLVALALRHSHEKARNLTYSFHLYCCTSARGRGATVNSYANLLEAERQCEFGQVIPRTQVHIAQHVSEARVSGQAPTSLFHRIWASIAQVWAAIASKIVAGLRGPSTDSCSQQKVQNSENSELTAQKNDCPGGLVKKVLEIRCPSPFQERFSHFYSRGS